jgi:3-isopropylmalate/(R)-2-methylmalate dehydratase small subunit
VAMPDSGIIASRTFNLPIDNIDTDQIYPGRYLTTTKRESLGDLCFYDWRHESAAGKQKLFAGFDPDTQSILVAGDNFGCGSSREHAAWAMLDHGFKAVISSKFPGIFESNAAKNGLLLVTVPPDVLEYLFQNNRHHLTIDIKQKTLAVPGLGIIPFTIDEFTAYCLLNGIDALDYLMSQQPAIDTFELFNDGSGA